MHKSNCRDASDHWLIYAQAAARGSPTKKRRRRRKDKPLSKPPAPPRRIDANRTAQIPGSGATDLGAGINKATTLLWHRRTVAELPRALY